MKTSRGITEYKNDLSTYEIEVFEHNFASGDFFTATLKLTGSGFNDLVETTCQKTAEKCVQSLLLAYPQLKTKEVL